MSNFKYLYVLFVFAFIISSGIHIFSRGFLLTRDSRTEKRHCDKFYINLNGKYCISDDKKTCSNQNIHEILSNVSLSAENFCFERKSKVLIVLIDALKYDFGIFNENLKDPLPYQNKMPIIHQLLKQHPDRTRLIKFIADPPTTTLQRLKGITTGSLPTFIDMGSNFATPEINEDNVIDQMIANNLSIVFAGDNTWTELFPRRFKRAYAYPSFNIHDLDSVDNAIMKILPNELKKPDWDVMITHFLGVDHCGHKHGPLHQEMSRKLTEMNDLIKFLSENIDDDTTLYVFGDHGMTIPSGDHGGATSDETEALLFAYSKSKNFVSKIYDSDDDFMQQIDLTPTLATVLGCPIPFSNLGTINFKLIPDVEYQDIKKHDALSLHLWHNAQQIRNYFTTYSNEHKDVFGNDDVEAIATKFEIFGHRVDGIFSEDAFLSISSDLRSTMDLVLELCRNIWIKFNPQLMTQGMLLVFIGIFTLFIIIYNIPIDDYLKTFSKNLLLVQTSASILAGLFGLTMHQNFGYDDKIIAFLFFASVSSAVFFAYVIIDNWSTIVDSMIAADKFTNLLSRISFGFSIVVFFSNSFIIQEQYILCFLLMIQIIHGIWEYRRDSSLNKDLASNCSKKIGDITSNIKKFGDITSNNKKFSDITSNNKKLTTKLTTIIQSTSIKITIIGIATIVLLRISQLFFKCREEQANCWDYMTNTENVSTATNLKIFPVILYAIHVTLVRTFLKANGNLTGYAPHVIFMKFCPTVAVVAGCGYLVLSQKQMTRPIASYVHLDSLAWIVYFVFFVEIVMVVVRPLLVHVVPQNGGQFSLSSAQNAIPELYRHMRDVIGQQGSRKAQPSIVYGLATVYSSVFVAFSAVASILVGLLLGIDACLGFLAVLLVAFGILFIFSVLRYETASNSKDCLQPTFSLITSYYLLYSYGFYSTSHQPTISQIDWNAAFVGRTANFDHSNVLSAVLVLVSTFNSNIVLLILHPLLVIFPFMIYSLWPDMAASKKVASKDDCGLNYRKITLNEDENMDDDSKDMSRGEINLHDNEHSFVAAVFKVGCQFVLLQGTKVLAAMIACTILCRHLMVWKIFAPRFIYEGIATYVSFIAIMMGFLMTLRVHRAVKKLIEKLIL